LVFFGHLAYQTYITQLGPPGKVLLLYLASASLIAAGWWWQRQTANILLQNYAQVLFAGGLAATYFTTYAAHHLEPLRIISSPVVDGVLLLVCAGFMVWAADRKKSEVLALFAILLAYYSAIITRAGMFTLFSNLLLTLAAVSFLVRNRWAALSFASLVATYLAYGFWRFFNGTQWHWASPQEGLWSGAAFLIAYWLVFTGAVLFSKAPAFTAENRSAFLTLNNGGFFALFLLTMLQVRHGTFWKFSLVFGAVLLLSSELARVLLTKERPATNAYLAQGLLLLTIGFISKFTGLQLALILAVQSVVLLMVGQQRKSIILLIGAYFSAALAVGWGMDGMSQFDRKGLILGMALGGLMLVNALLSPRKNASGQSLLEPQLSYFVVLALLIWLVATWNNCTRENFSLVLGGEAVLLTLSIYLLRMPELTLFAQGYMAVALFVWLAHWISLQTWPAWWKPTLLIAINAGMSHWWQKQRVLPGAKQLGLVWQALYGLGIVGVFYYWLAPNLTPELWLAVASALAVGLTAYGVLTRAWFIAAWGQLFNLISVTQFSSQLLQYHPDKYLSMVPIITLALLAFATIEWFKHRPDPSGRVSRPLLALSLLYRWAALGMSIAWVWEYVPARERIWILALLGLALFLVAGARRSSETLWFSAAYTATALGLFWLPLIRGAEVYWPNLVVLVLMLVQRQIARRLPGRYPLSPEVHNGIILLGGLSLWRFLSCWVLENASGFYLTASWSLFALALFAAGIMLRERMYRWLGLVVLGCALGRIALFDVWQLKTIYRILSLMALGIVLLVLGFIYNKYQEKIREWL